MAAQLVTENPHPHTPLRQWVADFVAGTAAGIVGKIVEYPFDTVKVRLQTMSSSASGGPALFSGPLDCIMKTYRTDGLTGFYRGVSPPIAGAAVETAVVFSGFGQMARLLGGSTSEDLNMPQVVIAGSSAGFAVAHVLTPIELIKCKMQVQTNVAGVAITKYNGPVDCIRSIVRESGVRGLFHGYQATVLREVPGNAAWFGFYEAVMRSLTPANTKRKDMPGYYSAVAGACGGLGYWMTMFPLDTVKSRMQSGVGGGLSNSFFGSFKNILANEGARGLYAGLGITLMRAMPSNAIIFCTYEYVTQIMLA